MRCGFTDCHRSREVFQGARETIERAIDGERLTACVGTGVGV
jgi:hypothetical protein